MISPRERGVTLGRIRGIEVRAGVALRTVDPDIRLPFPVEVDVDRIGGASAGLMLALTVYDLVDPVDLAGGRAIAGTGTMDLQGDVGQVGGVRQKVERPAQRGPRSSWRPPTRSTMPGKVPAAACASSR
jgi:PDZ domain-containing protein